MSHQTGADTQLLVVLVPAEPGQIIALCVKEQIIQVLDGAFHRRRFAGTQLFIYINQSVGIVLGAVLLEDGLAQALIVAEHLRNFLVRTDTQSTDKGGQRNLSVFIDPDICHIVGIHFVFQPCTTVRDDGCLEQILTGLVLFKGIVHTGGTYQLGDDNTLCTVDDKGTAFGHQREISHEDLAFLYVTGFLIPKRSLHPQGRCVGYIPLLALCNRIFGGVVDLVIHKIEHQVSVVVRDRCHVPENLFQALFLKPLIGILLHLNQVRHFQNFIDLAEAHSRVLAKLLGCNLHICHRRSPPFCSCVSILRTCTWSAGNPSDFFQKPLDITLPDVVYYCAKLSNKP